MRRDKDTVDLGRSSLRTCLDSPLHHVVTAHRRITGLCLHLTASGRSKIIRCRALYVRNWAFASNSPFQLSVLVYIVIELMNSHSDASAVDVAPPASPGPQEQLVSYGIRRRHERSTSDNTISPTASSERSINSSDDGPRRRPLYERRPYTDYGQMHRKIRVQTIAEDGIQPSGLIGEPTGSQMASDRRPSSSRNIQASTSTSSRSSGTSPVPGHHRGQSSESNGYARMSKPPSRPSSGHTWARTTSGSVWYERLRTSPERSKDSLSAYAGEVSPRLLVPLAPPKCPQQSGPPYHHTVKVEKSFTKPQAAERPAEAPPPASRRSSINPRRIFSAPLQLVRRLSFSRHKPKLGSLRNASPDSAHRGQRLADHKSLLKRDRTSEALRRVNSILRETSILCEATSPVSVINRVHTRSMSHKSSSSRGSGARGPKPKKLAGRGVKEATSDSRESLRQVPETTSYTSSQQALRMGAQPNNTPDERATYKVKRSPSAETEEYLKVDISVRGGTSYLPSEARRIHTPPLPQDGPDGKKRGFFFDYNGPKRSDSRQEEILDPASIPVRSTSRANIFGKKTFLSAGRIVTKARTNDWYEAKLAQLEDTEDDLLLRKQHGLTSPHHADLNRGRSGTQTSLYELKRQKEEDMFDLTIPEHLPSSTLCPRHPRYWRVVKGKGSQFRGCWMHGIGPWEDEVNFR